MQAALLRIASDENNPMPFQETPGSCRTPLASCARLGEVLMTQGSQTSELCHAGFGDKNCNDFIFIQRFFECHLCASESHEENLFLPGNRAVQAEQ